MCSSDLQKTRDQHADSAELETKEKPRRNKRENFKRHIDGDMPNDSNGEGNDDDKIPVGDAKHADRIEENRDTKRKIRDGSFDGTQSHTREIDASRHFVACGFFALSMGIFIVAFGKKRGDKGRRDL